MKTNKQKIKLLVTDVDGTLTDGTIYIGDTGETMKGFNVKDGYALHEMLPQQGIIPVIVTGRESKIVSNRAKELGIGEAYQGISNKRQFLDILTQKFSCTLKEIAYIGDDINDLEALNSCGYRTCPADAVQAIKLVCDYVSQYNGGKGAVRDICEKVIEYNED